MSIYDRDETPVRVSFTLPRYMLDGLDEYAEASKKSRAALLRSIICAELNVVDLDDARIRQRAAFPIRKHSLRRQTNEQGSD